MVFFKELNWPLFLIIIGLSAFIAFVGDKVGWKLSKKKLTIWGLRPRHTTSLITIFTGLTVALVTMMVLSFTVPSVYRALLGMRSLQQEIKALTDLLKEKSKELEEKTQRVRELESRIEELREIARRLNLSISAIRGRTIIYRAGELVYQKVIKVKNDETYLERELGKALEEADPIVRERGAEPPLADMRAILVHPDEVGKAISQLKEIREEAVVRFIAGANVVVGEWVPVNIEIYPNKLIFKRNEEIYSEEIDGSLTEDQLEYKVTMVLSKVKEIALGKGVLPEPLYHRVGVITAAEFYDTISKIKEIGKKVRLEVISKKDIYTIGPLEVYFRISEG